MTSFLYMAPSARWVHSRWEKRRRDAGATNNALASGGYGVDGLGVILRGWGAAWFAEEFC
jgi:hypothetical protein